MEWVSAAAPGYSTGLGSACRGVFIDEFDTALSNQSTDSAGTPGNFRCTAGLEQPVRDRRFLQQAGQSDAEHHRLQLRRVLEWADDRERTPGWGLELCGLPAAVISTQLDARDAACAGEGVASKCDHAVVRPYSAGVSQRRIAGVHGRLRTDRGGVIPTALLPVACEILTNNLDAG